jgi:hypothetical protein
MHEERDQEERNPIVEELETRILPNVVTGLTGLKMKVLGARRRLPQSYPELTSGGVPSRLAVLHGDLGILAGALEEAISRALTAGNLDVTEPEVADDPNG